MSMCLVRDVTLAFSTRSMADWLSMRRRVGEAGGRTRSSASSIRSQVRYFTASARATYSASQYAPIVARERQLLQGVAKIAGTLSELGLGFGLEGVES
eukprot:scaffold1418_cov260-Pinguiococcus_pyrenoidosus.AAC.3